MRATSVVSAGQRHHAAWEGPSTGLHFLCQQRTACIRQVHIQWYRSKPAPGFYFCQLGVCKFFFISFIYTAFKYLSWWWKLFYTHVDKEKKKVIVHNLGPVSSTSQKQSPLYSRAEWFLCRIRHLVESCMYCYDMFKYRRKIRKTNGTSIHDVHEI